VGSIFRQFMDNIDIKVEQDDSLEKILRELRKYCSQINLDDNEDMRVWSILSNQVVGAENFD